MQGVVTGRHRAGALRLRETELCRQLKVDQFPTFVIYKQGKEVWRKQGIVDAKELLSNF